MKPLYVDDVRRLLPETDALRPLLDRILSGARADRDRKWVASGELETLGGRLVEPETLRGDLPQLLDSIRAHLEGLYGAVLDAVGAMANEDPEAAAEALLRAAELEREAGRLEGAGELSAAALRLATGFRDRRRALPALMAGAWIARARGRWQEAEDRYREAERIAVAVGDVASAARAAVGRGNLAIDRGLWRTATERYEVAEGWVRQAEGWLPETWHIPLNRSIVAREEGRLEDAARELKLARRRSEGDEDVGVEPILDNAEGQILRARGRSGEAEVAFRIALERASGADAQVTISLNLADALLAQGQVLEAGEVVRRAEEIALTRSVLPRMPELYTVMGRVAELRGHADAFVFFERGLEIVRDWSLPDFERARVLEAYAAHDANRGEAEAARAHLREAARIYGRLGDAGALLRLKTLRSEGDGARG